MPTKGAQLAPFFGLHCRMHFYVELHVSGNKTSRQRKIRQNIEMASRSAVACLEKWS